MYTLRVIYIFCVIRKIKDMTKKVDEGQEEAFSKFEDGQQPKEFEKKKGSQNQDQNVQLQVCWL